ncbi:MAG: nitrous oxide reductase family maturation protein NosD [Acidobacteriota bacterium]|nr:nitrous oxide reductase family maturation protein NosD [Acidobacteriota bacterium]MDH3524403.1 nitrous oxide reductase family maturation protein NosD [Acidobacteriota bacterium]
MVRLILARACLAALALPLPAAELAVAPGELAAVLARAAAGDTLRLEPGIHPGPVRVDLPVRLQGSPGAILEGPGAGTVLTLTADGIAVSGLTVRGSGADLARDEAVILVAEARDVTVEGCRVEARAFGIYLEAGGGHHILGNEVVGDTALEMARRGNGIHLWNTEHNEIRGNRLVDVRDGVYLSFAHDNVIHANQGTGLRYGIHYMYSERNVLTENRFAEGTGGIALMFSMENRIEDNETVDNREFGVLCQQIERSRLQGNRASGNGRGFYVENSAVNRFAGNRVEGNGVGVFLTAGSEQNVFTGNRFSGNLVQVFEDRAGANAFFDEGRGNLWSDYAGFDWNGDGVGETPYRLNTAAATLMARRPVARWFWMSPVLALLDWWDSRLATPAVDAFDPFPLVGDAAVVEPGVVEPGVVEPGVLEPGAMEDGLR